MRKVPTAHHVAAKPSTVGCTPSLRADCCLQEHALSDSMDPALNLMRMNGIMRQAVKLIKGIKINLDQDHFELVVFSIIRWFKVRTVDVCMDPAFCIIPAAQQLLQMMS
jgi:hypothetical protein